MAYAREGLTRFTTLYGDNRGASISLNRNANTGLVPAGESWPVLLSQTNRLYPLPFNPDPTYPIAVGANRADNLNAFTPDIQIARVQTWTVGFARSISNSMAFEIRYIGNRGDNEWSSINYNCGTTNSNNCTGIRGENLVANGFLNEFKQAMTNLQANNASGVANRAGSFAYFGQGSGTSPLPIYLAYLNGRTDAGNPAAYGLGANGQTINPSTTYANSAIAGRLAGPNPNPNGAAVGSGLQPDAPKSGPGGWIPCQLLHRQPRRELRQRDRQRRVQQVQRAAARAQAPPVEGLLREPELSIRVRGRIAVRRLQLRPRVDRRPSDRQSYGPPRAQVPGGLDAAVRPRRAVRHRPEPGPQRVGERLEHHERRPIPDDRHGPRQRPAGRHVGGRPAGHVQVLSQGERVHRHRRDLDAARRCHPQHATGIQHEQRDGQRLLDRPRRARRDSTSRRPTRPTASR